MFNGAIDRRPALIARCTSAHDIAAVIALAREAGVPEAVHGGGHSVGGYAVCDRGVMVDLRPMKRIAVEAGCAWGRAGRGQAHGLGVTAGRVSSTGVAGPTLGSGSGWLERKLDYACDNLPPPTAA